MKSFNQNTIILSSILFLSALTLVACGGSPSKTSLALTADETFITVASCSEKIPTRFNKVTAEERIELEDLPEGSYFQFSSELRVDSKIKDKFVRFQTWEKVSKQTTGNGKTFLITNGMSCASARQAVKDRENFIVETEAPRTIRKLSGTVDSIFRKMGLSLNSGNASIFYSDEARVTGKDERGQDRVEMIIRKNRESEFDHGLDSYWDEAYFAHTAARTYEFRARKKMDALTVIHVRVVLEKQDANILEDGDIFIALPTVDLLH